MTQSGRIRRPEEESRLALPVIGKVKVGYKDERGFPKSVDYFIPAGRYESYFTKVFGEKPKVIQVVFTDDDPRKVCMERYEYRDDEGKLIASGDGENFSVWDGKNYIPMSINEHPNLMRGITKKYPNRLSKKDDETGWSIVLTITFIIPAIKGVAGVWQLSTKGSASTIPQIRNIFDELIIQRGRARSIICDLSVDFAKSQKPGQKSRYPVITLVPNESEENIQRIGAVYNQNQLAEGK